MNYKIDFKCNDKDELQSRLNTLYNYKDDINTKISHRSRLNLFYSLLNNLIKKNIIKSFDSAIDIGCNSGYYSKMISDFGFKSVLGVDIVPKLIDNANKNNSSNEDGKIIAFKELNAENIDTSQKYNFVLCTEVIEHTNNPSKVINNIEQILAPEGIAVITLPNVISWPYFVILLSYKYKNKPIDNDLKQHTSYPFYKSLKIFKNSSLKVIKTSGANLIFDDVLLKLTYKTKLFPIFNKLNFYMSKIWPFKYFTQFFFIVLKKENVS